MFTYHPPPISVCICKNTNLEWEMVPASKHSIKTRPVLYSKCVLLCFISLVLPDVAALAVAHAAVLTL